MRSVLLLDRLELARLQSGGLLTLRVGQKHLLLGADTGPRRRRRRRRRKKKP